MHENSIERCIEHAIHEILPFIEKKQITLNSEVEPPSGTLLFDSAQLEQVLVNLLDNGCKFTPRHGSITIRGYSIITDEVASVGLAEASEWYRIDVSDTGSGIASEHLEEIFDEYTSYRDSMTRSGAGLGLAICKIIVHAHNGRIWAASDNRGATFSCSRPSSLRPTAIRGSRKQQYEHCNTVV